MVVAPVAGRAGPLAIALDLSAAVSGLEIQESEDSGSRESEHDRIQIEQVMSYLSASAGIACPLLHQTLHVTDACTRCANRMPRFMCRWGGIIAIRMDQVTRHRWPAVPI